MGNYSTSQRMLKMCHPQIHASARIESCCETPFGVCPQKCLSHGAESYPAILPVCVDASDKKRTSGVPIRRSQGD
jgi:hypothetical protein